MAKAQPNPSFTVERADLLRALSAVAKTVEARNTYPILANVLLTTTEDSLSIRGTDTDIEITASCPAKATPGSITVPAKTLLEIVRKFADGAEVSFSLDKERAIVKSGRSRFQLGTLPVDQFPSISTGDFGEPFTIDLAALFKPVAFAASVDPQRHYMNGVYMHTAAGVLTAVATDGHRLAKITTPHAGADFAITVPTKTVNLVPQGELSLSVSAEKIRIEQGGIVIVSKLVEGKYPDYGRVIPQHNDRILNADRGGLVSVVDRLSVVANERGGRAVKLTASNDNLALEVTNPDFGVSSEDMNAEWDGEPYEIGFNTGYLLDLLAPVSGGAVKMAFSETMGPVVITGDNENWLGICMPMRV